MNLPNQLQCIIFDMDGVIIDSEEIHKKAYYETFGSIGVTVSDDLYKTITGSSTINAFQKLVTYFNLTLNPEDLVLAKRKRYVNFFENDPTLHLVKGVEELIKHFYDKGFTLILASSSTSLINFRGDFIKSFVEFGYNVFTAVGNYEDNILVTLKQYRVTPLTYRINRTALNPLKDLKTISELKRIIKTKAFR